MNDDEFRTALLLELARGAGLVIAHNAGNTLHILHICEALSHAAEELVTIRKRAQCRKRAEDSVA